LADRGGVIFLDVDPVEAWSRVQGTDRPLAADSERFRALLSRRRAAYESVADWVLPVGGKSIESLAEEISALVAEAGDGWQTQWGRRLVSTERASLIVGGAGVLSGLERRATSARAEGSRFFAITDKNVMRAWGDEVQGMLGETARQAVFVVEPGEVSKSVGTLERCWDWLAERGARRDDVVVALGGGVVGDLGGFAAATYQRGVALWQIPTSLLAQVDSSVGGKTAINLGAGKNLVGAFYQPDLVLSDPGMLSTLPDEDYVGGLGEVVKHALLISEEFFSRLEAHSKSVLARDADVVGDLVKGCVGYKACVVAEDERENGRRAVLNLGHTIGHAIEVVEGYGTLAHGQAVSLGLLAALSVSERLLGLDPTVRERTRALLEAFGLETATQLPPTDLLLSAVGRDKKARAGTSGFVGLRALGDPVWAMNVSRGELESALDVIRE
jgi:shikimate kinase/3-dehydroquinate synthase